MVDGRGDVDGRVEHLLHTVLWAGRGVDLQVGAVVATTL